MKVKAISYCLYCNGWVVEAPTTLKTPFEPFCKDCGKHQQNFRWGNALYIKQLPTVALPEGIIEI